MNSSKLHGYRAFVRKQKQLTVVLLLSTQTPHLTVLNCNACSINNTLSVSLKPIISLWEGVNFTSYMGTVTLLRSQGTWHSLRGCGQSQDGVICTHQHPQSLFHFQFIQLSHVILSHLTILYFSVTKQFTKHLASGGWV